MKEALKLALEALCVAVEPKKGKVYAREFEPIDCFAMHEQAITALREALAQPAQKRPQNCGTGFCSCIECVMVAAQEPVGEVIAVEGDAFQVGFIKALPVGTKLYTTPPAAQPPLPVQPEQESAFGWIKQSEIAQARLYGGSVNLWLEKHDCDFPVYTTPPAAQRPIHITWDKRGVRTVNGVPDDAQPVQEPDELTIAYMSGLYDGKKKRPWVGLTDEEIEEAYAEPTMRKIYQAIETALKEKNT